MIQSIYSMLGFVTKHINYTHEWLLFVILRTMLEINLSFMLFI